MNNLSQRQITLTVLIAYSIISLVLGVSLLFDPTAQQAAIIGTFVATIVFIVLSVAYWRGSAWAPHIAVAITALIAGGIVDVPSADIPIAVMIVPIIALVITSQAWVVGSAAVLISILIVRAALSTDDMGVPLDMGAYRSIEDLIVYVMGIVGLVVSRVVVDSLLRAARENADRAEQARADAEAKAALLAAQATDLARKNDEQRRLLDLVSTLEVPTVALADGVLLAPIVGAIDSRRAQDLTSRLLDEVSSRRTAHVILDISGVNVVDTDVARSLIQTIQALRLLGCQVVLTGITAPVAASMTSLGIDLAGVRTARSPQDVLMQLI